MTLSRAARDQHSAAWIRLLLFVVLAVGEATATSLLFVLDTPLGGMLGVQYVVRQLVLAGFACVMAFAVISWPKRQMLAESWNARVEAGSWRRPLSVNLALFTLLTIATIAFSRHVTTAERPPWGLYSAYLMLLAATGLSLAWLAAPYGFWRSLVTQHRLTVAVAVIAGIAALFAGTIAQAAWSELSGITLRLAHQILSLYETDVRVDYGTRALGVGTFTVFVDSSCSGYEGVGLVLVFLGLYLWVFQSSLRFPNALLLLPIGVCTIWLLNSVRIAALVSIGAHTSPEIAVDGFHSQAGWIAYLFVTIGIMATVPRLSFFTAGGHSAAGSSASDRILLGFLAPFMGLMAAGIVMAAVAPYDTWFYSLKVIAIGLCLWVFRDVLRSLIARVDAIAPVSGAIVGVLWIVTAPVDSSGGEVGAWITAQPLWLAAIWLTIRTIGTAIMVPIAEELAFRGLLYRWLISRNFESVAFSAFSWTALLVSSLLFGFLHQRWMAGALAGVAFALLMVRSNRLSDPIAAHMVANAIIIAWAIAAQNWSLI